ncbi:MAG TPA: hypothetical protein VFB32_15490 [Rudaea sp.]|nr:hypothetical protein [Rudaea sp.]
MSLFWKHLNRMAQDQLFAHGHLTAAAASEIAKRRETEDRRENLKAMASRLRPCVPHTQIAAYR